MKTPLFALALAALLVGCAQPQFTEGAKLAQRVDDKLAPDARIQYGEPAASPVETRATRAACPSSIAKFRSTTTEAVSVFGMPWTAAVAAALS